MLASQQWLSKATWRPICILVMLVPKEGAALQPSRVYTLLNLSRLKQFIRLAVDTTNSG